MGICNGLEVSNQKSYYIGFNHVLNCLSYAMQWLVVLPLEIIAASITINFWSDTLDHAIFVSLFLIIIVTINLFGVKGYGEAEFVFSIVKVIAVIGFM